MYTTDEFSTRLLLLMDKKGITQSALARSCYVVQPAISLYCSGKALPRADVLCALCNALEVNVDYFLKGD